MASLGCQNRFPVAYLNSNSFSIKEKFVALDSLFFFQVLIINFIYFSNQNSITELIMITIDSIT